MREKYYMTRKSLEEYRGKIDKLKSEDLRICLEALSDARDKGDISENAEYEIAKMEFDNLQLKIKQMESKLKSMVLIDEGSITNDKVSVLTKVTLYNHNTKKTYTYSIVPDTEVNTNEFKLSSNAPIIKPLLGKKVGYICEVSVPNGKVKLEVKNIESL